MKETSISIPDVVVEERLLFINIDSEKSRHEGASLLHPNGTLNEIREVVSQPETSQN
jgi:hypothetical protein